MRVGERNLLECINSKVRRELKDANSVKVGLIFIEQYVEDHCEEDETSFGKSELVKLLWGVRKYITTLEGKRGES